MHVHRRSSLLLIAALFALLSACTSPPPPFSVSSVDPATGGTGDLLTVGTISGDATAFLEVCGEVLDTTFVEGAYAFGGTTYGGRLTAEAPLFPTGTDCAVVARKGTATDAAGTFEYTNSPVAGRTVLVYANLDGGDATVAFDAALATLTATGVVVTRVATTADFVTDLTAGDFDVAVWIEELNITLTVAAVDAIADHVADGGRALFSYWYLYEPTGVGVPEARAALGVAGVTNVTPVEDSSIDATLGGTLALGLASPTVTLFNDGLYFSSYAARLDLAAFSSSTCTFADVTGGSCAVLANAGRSLVLGITFAPLFVAEGEDVVRSVLENALTTVVYP